jgi:IclR family acetate operon transcriptional repressor
VPQPRVQTLERALDLLEALASADELGVSDIAARTGLVPSTAHRLLGTLVARGYAAQNPTSGRYLMGYKLLELTSGLQDRLGRLRTAARAHLEAIQERTGETTNLVVLEGRSVVYIDSVSGTRSVRLFTEIGRAIPAHTSGAGKALLAWREPAEVAALLDGVEMLAATPHTLTSLDALQEDLARTRRRGYATDNEEHEPGVACVATPIFDRAGTPLAAISVSGPATRILHVDTADLAGLLREHAEQVRVALGPATRPPAGR